MILIIFSSFSLWFLWLCMTPGWPLMIGNSRWQQDTISPSTTKVEYIALTHAAKEAIWFKNLLSEIFAPITTPIQINSDNQSAIALAKDDHFHARTKHIDIRYHFIRYVVEEGKIRLTYCPTEDMTADIFTKALPSLKSKHFASSMGLAKVWGGLLDIRIDILFSLRSY